jgi:hypothetical protein
MSGCCTEAWSAACVSMAREVCDAPCASCEPTEDGLPSEVNCTSAADCWTCQNGDTCDGVWTCGQTGFCTPGEPVDCSGLDGGEGTCVVGACESNTGECYGALQSSVCDDADWCTNDWCADGSAMCMNEPIDGCDGPGCAEGAVSGCECADGASGESLCLEGIWGLCACATDPVCAEDAVQACGCDDGTEGTQSCNGEGWGPCGC